MRGRKNPFGKGFFPPPRPLLFLKLLPCREAGACAAPFPKAVQDARPVHSTVRRGRTAFLRSRKRQRASLPFALAYVEKGSFLPRAPSFSSNFCLGEKPGLVSPLFHNGKFIVDGVLLQTTVLFGPVRAAFSPFARERRKSGARKGGPGEQCSPGGVQRRGLWPQYARIIRPSIPFFHCKSPPGEPGGLLRGCG